MPAEGRENPLLKKGNSDAFFREKYLTKNTKTKSVFPSDSALEKMLYLASGNVTKKWTQRYRNWDQVLSQLILLYPERLTPYL